MKDNKMLLKVQNYKITFPAGVSISNFLSLGFIC